MNISVFGLGYVGCVSLGCLAKNGHNVIGVDISQVKVDQINSGKPTIVEEGIAELINDGYCKGLIKATLSVDEGILNSDLSIICVGTPNSVNGHLNLDFIYALAHDIAKVLDKKNTFHVITVRSTVMPGTGDRIADIIESNSSCKRDIDFSVVSNPEFLREGSAIRDYFNPPVTLIGSRNSKAAHIVSSLFESLPGQIVIDEPKVIEMMKYVNNTFHALKISFANEIGNISKAIGVDSHRVMEILCMDKALNISPYYLKPGFAYGGSCLPKDLKGLQTLAHDLYIKIPLINSINLTNQIQIDRAFNLVSSLGLKKIGVLGISFKAGTDDLRNSPSVELVELLLGKGYNIKIYDNNVHVSALTGTNKKYIDLHIPHLSMLMVSDINKLSDCDIIIINNKEDEYIQFVINSESSIAIVDMIRLPEKVRSRNNYFGINW
jgi:GDP-mannose 6-dehydrogenase